MAGVSLQRFVKAGILPSRIAESIEELTNSRKYVVIGVTEDSKRAYPGKRPVKDGSETIFADTTDALRLNTGPDKLAHVPDRPFLELAVKQFVQDHKIDIVEQVGNVLAKRTAEPSAVLYNRIGTIGHYAFYKYLKENSVGLAPNAPRTVASKGSAVPLVESGLLADSLSYEVRE